MKVDDKTGELLFLDYDTLVYLESLNLTYKQMLPYFAVKIDIPCLCRAFKKLGIKHKRQNPLYDIVKEKKYSIKQLSVKYKVSCSTISRIRRKIKENSNE